MLFLSHPPAIKKTLLYGLVASTVLGAVLGIVVILNNRWGWFEVRVLLTTLILAIASLCGLASELARMPTGRNWLPKLSLALCLSSTVMILSGIWIDFTSEAFWQMTWVSVTFSIAVVHICLLSIAKLSRRFRWLYFVACQLILGLASLISAMVFEWIQDDEFIRLIAVLTIAVAAVSLIIPVLHRVSRLELSETSSAPAIGTGTPHALADLATPLEARNLATLDAEIKQVEQYLKQLHHLRASLTPGHTQQSTHVSPPIV